MASRANAFQVGIMTLVVAFATFGILIAISQAVGGDMRELRIRFKSDPAMPTITEGSAVLVGGQVVGRVIEAHLETQDEAAGEKRNERMIRVRAEIREGVVLRKDCRVFAEGPPLGGDGVIKIDLGDDAEAFDGAYVMGADPGGFGALLSSFRDELDDSNPKSLLGQIKTQLDASEPHSILFKVHQSLDDLNTIIRLVGREADANNDEALLASVHTILNNLNQTTAALREELQSGKPDMLLGKVNLALSALNGGLETARRMLEDNEAPVGRTVRHVESTAEKLDNRIAENIARQTDPRFADGLIAKLNSAATELDASLADIHVITSTTREVVVLNRENINKLLMNFKETSDHLKSASKFILQRPWRLFNAPDKTETRQHAIFDAARNFAEAATRLDDATAQLRALAELHDGRIPGDSPDLARVRTMLTNSREKFGQAEAELWRQLGIK